MDTLKIKEIGKWMMLIGASVFGMGAGTYYVGNRIERKEALKKHRENLYKIEEDEKLKQEKIKEELLSADAEGKRLYSEKLKNMDQTAFAKFHADKVAVANENVLADAEHEKNKAKAEIVQIRLECRDEINKIKEQCLKRIEDAEEQKDAAIEKYEAIDTLLTNKDEILKAKKVLEEAIEKDEKAKTDRQELLESIKTILL